MKTKNLKIAALLALTFISSCQKETNPNPNTNPNTSNSAAGTYSGMVYTNLVKTPVGNPGLSCWVTETSNTSGIVSVNVTTTNGQYYLNNDVMNGGPNVFTLNKNGANYVLNITSKSIQYSKSASWKACYKSNCGACTDYTFAENSNGTLNQ
jgi:hypothetical protein